MVLNNKKSALFGKSKESTSSSDNYNIPVKSIPQAIPTTTTTTPNAPVMTSSGTVALTPAVKAKKIEEAKQKYEEGMKMLKTSGNFCIKLTF